MLSGAVPPPWVPGVKPFEPVVSNRSAAHPCFSSVFAAAAAATPGGAVACVWHACGACQADSATGMLSGTRVRVRVASFPPRRQRSNRKLCYASMQAFKHADMSAPAVNSDSDHALTISSKSAALLRCRGGKKVLAGRCCNTAHAFPSVPIYFLLRSRFFALLLAALLCCTRTQVHLSRRLYLQFGK